MIYKEQKMKRKSIIYFAGISAVLLIFLSCAHTGEITDSDGRVISGSIASLEEVQILGVKQWLLIRGKNENAPVLLWLSGGPGGSEIGRNREYLSALEDSFVFVTWEQPGTGKSFSGMDIRKAGYESYVEHTIAVSEYLAERFNREKIYLVGHSWGSIIGILAAQQRPDLFEAYVGVGQQVDFIENDITGYDLVLKNAAASGDEAVISRLTKNGPPPYSADQKGNYAYLFQKVFTYSPSAPGSKPINSMGIFTPEEYTIIDTVNLVRGLIRGVDHIYPQLVGLDFRKDIPRLEVPAYFITGRWDYTCVQDLAWGLFSDP